MVKGRALRGSRAHGTNATSQLVSLGRERGRGREGKIERQRETGVEAHIVVAGEGGGCVSPDKGIGRD